jgi:ubiquinone/menaquinone biosynthesis C-methylase UbiE
MIFPERKTSFMPQKYESSRFKRLMSSKRRKELPPGPIFDEIGLRSGQTFVDIGAGPGFFTLPAAAIVGPGGCVFGLDISPVMIKELRKNAARKNLKNVHPLPAEETAAELPAGADFYFMANVFHELDNRAAYLRRIRKSMSPDSRLVIIDFLKKKTLHGPPLHERISLREIGPILIAAGFAVERIFRPNSAEYGIIARRKYRMVHSRP